MPENETSAAPEPDPVAELLARADALERRLAETEQAARERLIRAELKVEALRAGIVDLDGLKLLDPQSVQTVPDGALMNGAEVMAQLRRAKPWLFSSGTSSSTPVTPPPAQPPRQKLATEMTDDEYRAARAALLKHHP